MRKITRNPLAALCLLAVFVLPVSVVAADEEPVELDKLTVEGVSEQMALRTIQVALDRKPSSKAEDLDKMVCWFDKSTGSHQTYLYCGTNRALQKTRWYLQGSGAPPERTDVMSYRIDRGELERKLSALGPVSISEEMVSRTMAGENMPENPPSKDELDQFAQAFGQVRKITSEYDPRIAAASGGDKEAMIRESDTRMARAIEDAGLTVERYNQISELVTRYVSMRDYVKQKMPR